MKYKTLHIITLFALASCSSATDTPMEPDATPIFISPGGNALSFSQAAFSRGDSRAEEEDPQSKTAIKPQTVGLFGEMSGYMYDIFYNQIVYNKNGAAYADAQATVEALLPVNFVWPINNDWVYAPLKFWNGTNHQFYCYAPHTSTEGTSIALTANSYGAMKSFQISDIPPYSSYDYTVADSYIFKSNGSVTDPVPFNMKHISARICLRLKIGEEYSKMRKILVKKVTVNDRTVDGTYFQCQMTLNDHKADNVLTVTATNPYTPVGANPQIFIIPIFESAGGLELRADAYQQFGSLYVMPQRITTLTINVEYDVYDNVNETTPVRLNQKVSNTISLFQDMESGKYYNINIVVSPKYLYVLSDNDVKPDIIISPEE